MAKRPIQVPIEMKITPREYEVVKNQAEIYRLFTYCRAKICRVPRTSTVKTGL